MNLKVGHGSIKSLQRLMFNFVFGHVFWKDVVFAFCVNQKAGAGLEGAVAVSGLAIKNTRSLVGRRWSKKPHPIESHQIVVILALLAYLFTPSIFGEKNTISLLEKEPADSD